MPFSLVESGGLFESVSFIKRIFYKLQFFSSILSRTFFSFFFWTRRLIFSFFTEVRPISFLWMSRFFPLFMGIGHEKFFFLFRESDFFFVFFTGDFSFSSAVGIFLPMGFFPFFYGSTGVGRESFFFLFYRTRIIFCTDKFFPLFYGNYGSRTFFY